MGSDLPETRFVCYFGSHVGDFPIKYYLGVPLHHDRLSVEDLQPLLHKILKRIAA